MLNSPVRRMPPEITAEIFLYLSAESSVLPSGLVSGLSSPLILGQICRNWRAIALSLSRLWSSFEARFPDRNNGRSDQRTRLMENMALSIPPAACDLRLYPKSRRGESRGFSSLREDHQKLCFPLVLPILGNTCIHNV